MADACEVYDLLQPEKGWGSTALKAFRSGKFREDLKGSMPEKFQEALVEQKLVPPSNLLVHSRNVHERSIYAETIEAFERITSLLRPVTYSMTAVVGSSLEGLTGHWMREGERAERLSARVRQLEGEVELLRGQVARLQAILASRKIWRLGDLQQQLADRGDQVGRDREEIGKLQALAVHLHNLCLRHGLDCMPSPQVDIDGGDFELAWISVRRKRSIAFGIENNLVELSWLDDARGDYVQSPSEEFILHKLKWVIGESGE